MKHLYLMAAFTGIYLPSRAQSVEIGTTNPNRSAALDVQNTTQGLLLPRLTTAQIQVLGGGELGQLVFNTTTNTVYRYRSASLAASIDQPSQNSQTTYFDGTSGIRQSFTAPANGVLNKVTLYLGLNTGSAVTDDLTVLVYTGRGTAGMLLGSVTQAVRLTTDYPSPAITFRLPPGIVLTANQVYTFEVKRTSSGQLAAMQQNTNPYAGGQVEGAAPVSPDDLQFRLAYTQTGKWVPLH
ncbi:hypothetical protein DNI29_16845 [Hymenobacter sediminis]|uniref:hypothetical protein n=1 Tax=Hymenobacter sediminis TaxID=2218621 RepID=UPI000F4DC65F|nr:hypothetical protein [Hymenobacter sediminis]RPD45817.1 hypothetical protein DNI29_16845 [Hymenobacter sediminis]